ncbi:hypothetical protein [Pseudogulbenkiania subflava]|uniref:hypothetical protein n=1 Tax=Pseudogulbenkiania subflava TaxID=451637 RepID=UPI001179D620|nr:hypothetical protein [Pseudogulbenkiania subflava]
MKSIAGWLGETTPLHPRQQALQENGSTLPSILVGSVPSSGFLKGMTPTSVELRFLKTDKSCRADLPRQYPDDTRNTG